MIVMVGIGPRLAGLTDQEFSERWAGRHADLVRRLTGLRRYVQHNALLRRPHPGFDCFAKLHFDDVHVMKTAFQSDHYRQAVALDEADLVVRERMLGLRSELVLDEAGDPPAALVHVHRAEVAPDSPVRCRRLPALPGDRTGIRAVDIVAFESPEAALAGARDGAFVSRPRCVL